MIIAYMPHIAFFSMKKISLSCICVLNGILNGFSDHRVSAQVVPVFAAPQVSLRRLFNI